MKELDNKKEVILDIDDLVFDKGKNILNLSNKNINFLYANNGVGKTKLSTYLNNNCNDYYMFSFDNTLTNTETNSIMISKNIKKINELNLKNNEIIKSLKKLLKEYFCIDYLSTGGNLFKNNYKDFLNENENYKFIKNFFVAKNNFNKYLEKISSNFNENDLIKNYNKLKKMNLSINQDKFFNLEKTNYIDIKNIVNDIKKNIKEVVKDKLKNLGNELNFDYFVLQEVYDSISKLNDMKNCYICNTKIDNFEKIKTQIQLKLKEVDDNKKVIDLKNKIKKLDLYLGTNILDYFNEEKLNNLENVINDIQKSYNDSLLKIVIDFQNILERSKIEELINNKNKIYEFEKDKVVKVIKEVDLNFCKNLLDTVLGKDKIDWSKINENEIILPRDNESGEILLSSGEIRLACFIINLFFFISEGNNQNKFLILDDIDDLLDKLNRFNIEYIIKLFHNEYKIKYLILTHNYNMMLDLWKNGYKKINFILMYKNAENLREIQNFNQLNNDQNFQISFFSFVDGKNIIFKIIKNIFEEPYGWTQDKIILFLYYCYLKRINEYIWLNRNKRNNNFFEILKDSFILKNNSKNSCENNKKIFKNIFDILKDEIEFNKELINEELYLDFNLFQNKLFKLTSNFKNIIIMNKEFNNYPIIKQNIILLIKILITREKIRLFIKEKLKLEDLNDSDDDSWLEKIYKIEKKQIINANERKNLTYSLSVLDNFFHIENEPSLILHGIEFNDKFLNEFIENIEKCIEK